MEVLPITHDQAVDQAIGHICRTLEHPSYSFSDVVKGACLLTPLGHLFPERKKIFDLVWSRRNEWYDGVMEARKTAEAASIPTDPAS